MNLQILIFSKVNDPHSSSHVWFREKLVTRHLDDPSAYAVIMNLRILMIYKVEDLHNPPRIELLPHLSQVSVDTKTQY